MNATRWQGQRGSKCRAAVYVKEVWLSLLQVVLEQVPFLVGGVGFLLGGASFALQSKGRSSLQGMFSCSSSLMRKRSARPSHNAQACREGRVEKALDAS